MMFLLLLGLALILAYRYLRWHFSVFKRLNIPGPEPSIISGNLVEMLRQGQLQAMVSWGKTYGRVFGYYEGWTPVIAVSDPDMLRDILVKDFENFRSRKPFPLAPRKSLGLFLENGDQWKRSRTMLTPAFSSGKLRQMFSTINESVDSLVDNTIEKCDQQKPYDVYNLYQCLTLDVIGRCAFGLQTDAQCDENDPFMQNIRMLFEGLSKTFIQPLVMLIPLLSYFIFALKNVVFLFGMNPVVRLRNQMREVLKIRKQLGPHNGTTDLVQLMAFPNIDTTKHTSRQIQPMSEREIVAQSLTFLLAGYETTSAVLAYLTHTLATHDDVQDKLCEEIDDVIKGREVTYELVNKLPYFDMVIDEVCRLYPTASLIITRQAATTKTYKGVTIPAGMAVQANVWQLHRDSEYWDDPNKIITRQAATTKTYKGITIPAGMAVQANVWQLHRDSEYWDDPETFDPSRFSSENKEKLHKYSYLPFGAGPRMCIGQRFAILEIKLAVARILQHFTFSKCSDTEESLTLVSRGAIVPSKGVNLRVTRRHSI